MENQGGAWPMTVRRRDAEKTRDYTIRKPSFHCTEFCRLAGVKGEEKASQLQNPWTGKEGAQD